MYCFTGRKQKVAKGCYYSISLDSDERKRSKGQSEESQFIGKVRSDRKAVEYWLYDDGANPEKKEEHGPLRREMLFVSFVNSLRNRNPGAMEVVVPGVDAETLFKAYQRLCITCQGALQLFYRVQPLLGLAATRAAAQAMDETYMTGLDRKGDSLHQSAAHTPFQSTPRRSRGRTSPRARRGPATRAGAAPPCAASARRRAPP